MTVVFIVGPTAVGKTPLAVKLARRLNGEIISCDSMQVYRGMEILSQAPTSRERKGVRHHLIGILSPQKEYSAAVFRKRCGRLIDSIIKRKKLPIVVGGSGLYVKALIDGLFPSPPADIKFRGKMSILAARRGNRYLHERLANIDPGSAAAIHPNDTRRIIRSLEIYNSTGRTMTELKAATHGIRERYNVRIFGLTRPRGELYSAINSRVERMFGNGAVKETGGLKKKRLSKTARAALGFKEISAYLDGRCGLEEAKDLLKMNTRRFAKRQITWFKADGRIRWFDVRKRSQSDIVGAIVNRLAGWPVGQFKPANRQMVRQAHHPSNHPELCRGTGKPAN